jgi:hypothetical protein
MQRSELCRAMSLCPTHWVVIYHRWILYSSRITLHKIIQAQCSWMRSSCFLSQNAELHRCAWCPTFAGEEDYEPTGQCTSCSGFCSQEVFYTGNPEIPKAIPLFLGFKSGELNSSSGTSYLGQRARSEGKHMVRLVLRTCLKITLAVEEVRSCLDLTC